MVTVRKLVLKYGVNRVPDKEDSQVGLDTLVMRGVALFWVPPVSDILPLIDL